MAAPDIDILRDGSLSEDGDTMRIGIRRTGDWQTETSEVTFVVFNSDADDDDYSQVRVEYSNGATVPSSNYAFDGDVGIVVIPAGIQGVWIYYEAEDDNEYEGREQFVFGLVGATNGNIVESSQVFSIEDNDPEPDNIIRRVRDDDTNEGGIFSFKVELRDDAVGDVTGKWRIIFDGDADSDDVRVIEGEWEIEDGDDAIWIQFGTQEDLQIEGDETFTIELFDVNNATWFDQDDLQATGTIVNDDEATDPDSELDKLVPTELLPHQAVIDDLVSALGTNVAGEVIGNSFTLLNAAIGLQQVDALPSGLWDVVDDYVTPNTGGNTLVYMLGLNWATDQLASVAYATLSEVLDKASDALTWSQYYENENSVSAREASYTTEQVTFEGQQIINDVTEPKYVDGRLVINQPLFALDGNSQPIAFRSDQGRYDAADTMTSHTGLNAHSFDWGGAAAGGRPIYIVAPTDAYVLFGRDDVKSSDGEGANGSFGNILTLRAKDTDEAGNSVYITFAHIAEGSIPDRFAISAVSSPSTDTSILVPAGTILGVVGDTGWGPVHLHMQVGTQFDDERPDGDLFAVLHEDQKPASVPSAYMLGLDVTQIASRADLGGDTSLSQDYGWPAGDTRWVDSDGDGWLDTPVESAVADNIKPTFSYADLLEINEQSVLQEVGFATGGQGGSFPPVEYGWPSEPPAYVDENGGGSNGGSSGGGSTSPEWAIVDAQVGQQTVGIDDRIMYSFSADNIGDGVAVGTSFSLYLSADQVLDPNSDLLAFESASGLTSIEAGVDQAYATPSGAWFYNDLTTTGQYYVIAQINGDQTGAQSVAVIEQVTVVQDAPMLDIVNLLVDAFNITKGDESPMTFDFAVQNTGIGATANNTTVSFVWSADDVYGNADDVSVAGDITMPYYWTGDGTTWSGTVTAATLDPGTYNLIAQINGGQAGVNGTAIIETLTVTGDSAELAILPQYTYVDQFTVTEGVGSIEFDFDVDNIGDEAADAATVSLYWSDDLVWDGGDTSISGAFEDIAPLPGDDYFEYSSTVDTSLLAIGTHHLIARIEGADVGVQNTAVVETVIVEAGSGPTPLVFTHVDGDGVLPDPTKSWETFTERFWGTDGDDVIDGGSGNDNFVATLGNDYYAGGVGDNQYTIYEAGVAVSDYVWSHDQGDDILRGVHAGLGTDYFDGTIAGFWSATASLGGVTWVSRQTIIDNWADTFDFGGSTPTEPSDPPVDPPSPDTLVFTMVDGDGTDVSAINENYDEEFAGTAGDDVVDGGVGNNYFLSSGGTDYFRGGDGNDQYVITHTGVATSDYTWSYDDSANILRGVNTAGTIFLETDTVESIWNPTASADGSTWHAISTVTGWATPFDYDGSTPTEPTDPVDPVDPPTPTTILTVNNATAHTNPYTPGTFDWLWSGSQFAGDETINGSDQADEFVVSSGDDFIFGGAGYDQVSNSVVALADLAIGAAADGSIHTYSAATGYDVHDADVEAWWFAEGGWQSRDAMLLLADDNFVFV